MIINLRGTNGAGKTTIVGKILRNYDVTEICYRVLNHPIRRTMIGQVAKRGSKSLYVPGHHNGGIDTIPTLYLAYDMIFKHFDLVDDIIYEGKNLTENLDFIFAIYEAGIDVRVIFIDHPVDKCIASVRDRKHSIREQTIIQIDKKCQKEFATLSNAGVRCIQADRDTAFKTVAKWLELPMGGDDARTESAERLPSTE